MPIYEYECEGCQAVHEVVQKMSDAPMATCPTCGKPVRKLISRSSFHLKGTGWYNTDYRKSSAPPAEKAASTEAKSEPKSEAAPAEKPAAKAETPNPSKPKAS